MKPTGNPTLPRSLIMY